jgi:hypothetical protein
VPQSGTACFLSNSCHFIIHLTTRRYLSQVVLTKLRGLSPQVNYTDSSWPTSGGRLHNARRNLSRTFSHYGRSLVLWKWMIHSNNSVAEKTGCFTLGNQIIPMPQYFKLRREARNRHSDLVHPCFPFPSVCAALVSAQLTVTALPSLHPTLGY